MPIVFIQSQDRSAANQSQFDCLVTSHQTFRKALHSFINRGGEDFQNTVSTWLSEDYRPGKKRKKDGERESGSKVEREARQFFEGLKDNFSENEGCTTKL